MQKVLQVILSLLLVLGLALGFGSPTLAHEGHVHEDEELPATASTEVAGEVLKYSDTEEIVARNSFYAVGGASVILVLLILISLGVKKPKEPVKLVLFWSMAGVVCLTTIYLAAVTVWLNMISSSKGPVHWHADYEVWNCGKEIELIDPKGLSNKIGTATLHEHNDKRIHLEGVVVVPLDASLGKFMHVTGGSLAPNKMTFVTNEGEVTLESGAKCGETETEFQVFAFKVNDDKTYTQTKLTHPSSHIIGPHSQVPPGDCIIFELDAPKDRTDRLCKQFMVAKEIGKLGEETER